MRLNLRHAALAATLGLALLQVPDGTRAADDKIVPTREEPRHVGKLENATVRIVDVEIPPGDRTLFHEHAIDYAYVMIGEAQLSNEVWGTPVREVRIGAGDVGYYRSVQGVYVHRFSNVGKTTFRAIGIELLAPFAPGAVAAPLPQRTGYVTVLDNERVRAYRLVLEPGETAETVTLRGPSVRVAVSGERIEQLAPEGARLAIDLAPAAFEWRAGPATHAVRNTGTSRVEIVEFELK
jgi:quercetin dioxygenase-like cupin family protein